MNVNKKDTVLVLEHLGEDYWSATSVSRSIRTFMEGCNVGEI